MRGRAPGRSTMASDYAEDPGVRLMLAYQAGDEPAFDELVERYSGQVYGLVTRFLGPVAEREDLVQDVFLRVVRARARYRPAARFSTWLFRIVYNLSLNHTQRAGPPVLALERAGAGRGNGDDWEPEDSAAREPAGELARVDLVRAVRAAIARLPESQRMALVLAKYEELPYVEIGLVLGTSEKAVKSLVHRARENLRAVLGPWLEQETA